jgi:hypothetical protein
MRINGAKVYRTIGRVRGPRAYNAVAWCCAYVLAIVAGWLLGGGMS